MAAKDAQADADPIIIKKYANRRLYNTAKSTYVTLDHLSAMVREGDDFVVRDAKSGEDITRSVLTQIIFEEEAKGASMLPTNFLRQIISLYGDSLQSVVPGYLEASMETFGRNQENMRNQMARMFGADQAIESFESMTRTNIEWFDRAMSMFSPFKGADGEPGAPPKEESETRSAGSKDDLATLKSQLAAMQSQLTKLSGGS